MYDGKPTVFINSLGYIFHLSVHIKLDVSLAFEKPVKSIEVIVGHTLSCTETHKLSM